MGRPETSQFAGCLVGQCLADALGARREGFPREECETYVAGPLQRWYDDLPAEDPPPVQYTDDSQLARELMQSFAEVGGFDPPDYARRIAAIFVEDRIVGRGLATHNAAMQLAAGVPWDQAGTPPPVAGNGSAMRAGPVGLFSATPDELLRVAHDQGRITHQDPRCAAGAVAIAGAVYLAARSRDIDSEAFLGQLSEWTSQFDVGFAECMRILESCLTAPLEYALDRIAELSSGTNVTDRWDRISPYVVPSVAWSLYSFLRFPGSFRDAVGTAIRAGGDVDTTAAMTGAISGAHLGLAALPSHLARGVEDRGTWGYADLVALAEQCYARARGD